MIVWEHGLTNDFATLSFIGNRHRRWMEEAGGRCDRGAARMYQKRGKHGEIDGPHLIGIHAEALTGSGWSEVPPIWTEQKGIPIEGGVTYEGRLYGIDAHC